MAKPIMTLGYFLLLLISTLNVTTTSASFPGYPPFPGFPPIVNVENNAPLFYFYQNGPMEDFFKIDDNLVYTGSETNNQPEEGDIVSGLPPPPATTIPHPNSLINKNKLGSTTKPPLNPTKTPSLPTGSYFRESDVKSGNILQMPNITDRFAPVKLLTKNEVSTIPFTSSKLPEIKHMFHAEDGSRREYILKHALEMCEMKSLQGEIKKCVASEEDLKEFATTCLGQNVRVRRTENCKGSKEEVLVGEVRGGEVIKTVACHQMVYPYTLYLCHTLPKVKVYDVDILDHKTKEKVNKGVAICHMDTSGWRASHPVFELLGSKPGKTEACHWVFEPHFLLTKSGY